MITVAHFSGTFFVKSETFIYYYIAHMQQVRSLCLAWNLENLDYFSFPREDVYCLQLRRWSPGWLTNGIKKRFTGRDSHFEAIMESRGVRVLHAHFGHNGVQALELKHHLNIPLVTTFYGADLSKYEMIEGLRKKYLDLFAQGELFLVEGPFMKKVLVGLGCKEEKIRIQRIAIPVDSVGFREREAKKGKGVKLVFCGRFTGKKGLLVALAAVKKAREQSQDFTFCLIGDGELRGEIERYIHENAMGDYVELAGFLSYEEYLKRVNQADIFLHPSVTALDGDSEGGAPTTILEAQAMGLPVISTLHADIPNVVVPGESALLSAERDVDGLAGNILYLLEHRELWKSMGRCGRDFVERQHNIIKEAERLEKLYYQLAS